MYSVQFVLDAWNSQQILTSVWVSQLTSVAMSAIRSSVRPKSSKQNWGTILKPEFGLGYQRLTNYEIKQTVERLYKVKSEEGRTYDQPSKSLPEEEIRQMVKLTSLRSHGLRQLLVFSIIYYVARLLILASPWLILFCTERNVTRGSASLLSAMGHRIDPIKLFHVPASAPQLV